ncbi:ABC-F family ATP-binding cassette domain-containing protein [Auritidibacter ignavus]|uniref:ABC-F family ATP-binding cassette domain-containing protein n=1 Tax=Auritidibacter ignavus TaxID=678932 RepID=UPI00109CE677|nr:ABC-F family ATP-binding cassette domain-containing protein [Auritidibacter ignavus]
MAHLLGAENISMTFGTRTVLDGVTLGISEGQRIGIVGRNGDGKSTLLSILTSQQSPDTGRVTTRNGLRIGVLTQSDELRGADTVGYSIVGDRAEYEWASHPRIRSIISGLVADLNWNATISTLSGGQRRRVALAQLLVEDWDVIGLDEPTNHLDLEGIRWLADHLNQRWTAHEGGLLVITHDRWFLDAVCTDTWEVHHGMVEPFEGGYAAYVLQKVERQRIAAAAEAKRQNLMRKELAWLRRGAPARTSKPKFRLDAAAELISQEPPVRDSIQLQALAVSRLGKDVVDLENVSVDYDGTHVLNNITWRIAPGERTGILGANGAGKSTLLGLIAGTVEPDSGRVKRGKTVKLGVLDQKFSQLETIRNDRVRDVLARTKTSFTIDGKDFTPAQLLERLGFSRDHLSTPVRDLSGGQKRRLQLLLVLLSEPNVLILDEPTNDVDHEMLTAMEDVLDSWPGTLLVVSHDRYLLERVTDQQYAIIDGTFRHLPGGVDQYLQLAEQAESQAKTTPSRNQEQQQHNSSGADNVAGDEQSRGLSGAEKHAARKEASSIERKLEKLNTELTELEEKMAAHDQTDFEGLADLTVQVSGLREEIDIKESRWLELLEAVES